MVFYVYNCKESHNHHVDQLNPRHGKKIYELDFAFYFLILCQYFGLVKIIKAKSNLKISSIKHTAK